MNLIDNCKEVVFTINNTGKILFANKTGELIFGFTNDEFVTISFIDLISTNNEFDVLNRIVNSPNNGFIEEVILVKKNKAEITCSVRVFTDENSKVIYIYLSDLTSKAEFRKEISEKVKVVEALSKSSVVRKGKIDQALDEILKRSLEAVNVERVNVWITNKEFSEIECIGNYSTDHHNIVSVNDAKGNKLYEKDFPKYFQLLKQEEVIVTNDASFEPQVQELEEIYLKPNKITSMLDLPLRSNGKMIGVLCFENTGPVRKWNVYEVKFGILVSQIISLLLENQENHRLLVKQERLHREKEALYREINERVKQAFNLMNSILRLDEEKIKDDYHKHLFIELKHNILNISSTYDIILASSNFSKVDCDKKILRLVGYMQNIYPVAENINYELKIKDIYLPVNKALSLILIVNQFLQISYEYSLKNQGMGNIEIALYKTGEIMNLVYMDDGIVVEEDQINNLLEFNIAELFAKDLDGKISITTNSSGNKYKVSFPA